jgi:ribosomal protein S18 acetylase RimI-like enzyme
MSEDRIAGTAIHIRRAQPDDAALLAQVGRETFLRAFEGQIDAGDLTAFADKRYGLDQQTAEMSEPRTLFLIADVDGNVAGTARLCESSCPDCISASHAIELERLYLYPQWFGKGVAHVLMERCLAEARARSREVMWLDVWDRNRRAEAFYRKYGFAVVGERPYVVGNIVQRHLLMARVLARG